MTPAKVRKEAVVYLFALWFVHQVIVVKVINMENKLKVTHGVWALENKAKISDEEYLVGGGNNKGAEIRERFLMLTSC